MLRSYFAVGASAPIALNPQDRNESRIERHWPRFAGLIFALSISTAAFGQLARVGPIDNSPSGGGYPAWYQDKTGLTLEFCSPKSQAELLGGWCVFLPPDVTVVPETFPTNFFNEHFYFLANAKGTTTSGATAKLVLALEGAFAGGATAVGDQIAFARVRAVITPLPVGDYAVYHPYGRIPNNGYIHIDQGGKFSVTQDVGLACASGPFNCALSGQIGPFLLPSSTAGGAEIGPTTGPGGQYIADPARNGPITGSPINQNVFRVAQAAANNTETTVLETTDFTLNGRIHTGLLPSVVNINRAVYSDDGATKWVDVFATALPAMQARIPGSAVPGKSTPQLQYFLGACSEDPTTHVLSSPGGSALAMKIDSSNNNAWGEHILSNGLVSNICVQDLVSGAFFGAPVAHEVSTQASYDGTNLTVNARSSDVTATLNFNGSPFGPGSGSVTKPVTILPDTVLVSSSSSAGGGSGQARVFVTAFSGDTTPTAPVLTAQNLLASVAVGASVTIPVPNANATGALVTLGPDTPKLGTATVGPTNNIVYTAGATPGTDTFTYQLNNSSATVTVTVTAQAPPVGTPEAITVTAANYRGDQKRWQINGTDNLSSNQILTIKNVGPAGSTKNVVLGTAVVTAGAWTLDIRNIATGLIPVQGDRVVAVRTDVTPNITSAPVTAVLTKLN